MLKLDEVRRIMKADPIEGKMETGYATILKTWYNHHILHIDVYKKGEHENGNPIEKWIVMSRGSLFAITPVWTDKDESEIISSYEQILSVLEEEESKTITIEVYRGMVSEVRNLPEGWDYEIIDHDNQDDAEEGWMIYKNGEEVTSQIFDGEHKAIDWLTTEFFEHHGAMPPDEYFDEFEIKEV